jgi:hypothetical protein
VAVAVADPPGPGSDTGTEDGHGHGHGLARLAERGHTPVSPMPLRRLAGASNQRASRCVM